LPRPRETVLIEIFLIIKLFLLELTSIKYATKLDYASFDVVGNTTNGKRNGWIFARSLNDVSVASDVLSRLCFESHCMLSEDNTGKYKLVALDTDTSTTNLIDESQIIGTPVINRTKTIYNAFDFGYSFNYATGAFEKSVVVDALQSGLVADTTLITNGTFAGDSVAGWSTYGTGGIAGAGEVGTITTSAVNSGEYQTLPISIVSGRTYIISIDQTITSGTWKLRLPKTISHTGTVIGGSAEQTFSGSTLDYSFTASETADCYFMIWCASSGQEIIVDNITMYEDGFNYASFTPDESSSIVNYGGDAVTSLCGVSQSRYLKRYSFNENLIWHYDTTTLNSFVKKFIEWNYSPKIVLKLTGWRGNSFTTGYKPLLAYELGDQCKVDHPILDPDISSVYVFMVVGKSIDISSNEVTLTLMQMR